DLPASGVFGMLIADYLVSVMNRTGALIVTAAGSVIALYLISTFEIALLGRWFAGPIARWNAMRSRLHAWSAARREKALERAKQRAAERTTRRSGGKRAPKRAGIEDELAQPRTNLAAEGVEQPGVIAESAPPVAEDA